MSVTINISENTDTAGSVMSSISTQAFDLEPPPPTESVEAATTDSDEMPAAPPAPTGSGENSDMSFNDNVPTPPNDEAVTGDDAYSEGVAPPPEENGSDQATEAAIYNSGAIALADAEENNDGAIPPAVAVSEGRAELNLADLHNDPPVVEDEPNFTGDDFAGENFDDELPPALDDESNKLEAPAKKAKAVSNPKKKK